MASDAVIKDATDSEMVQRIAQTRVRRRLEEMNLWRLEPEADLPNYKGFRRLTRLDGLAHEIVGAVLSIVSEANNVQ